jgi:hypothetical protein
MIRSVVLRPVARCAVMLALLLSMAACGFDALGTGVATEGGSSGATEPGSASDPSGAPGPSESSSASSTSSEAGSDSDATASATASTTSSTDTTTTDGTTTADTDAPDVLVGDDAVVVRYYLDEVEEGEPGPLAFDAAGPPALDLAIAWDAGTMTPRYVNTDGHRGLHWPQASFGGSAIAPVLETKMMALDGRTEATLEVVVDMQAVFLSAEPWARILVWQPDIVPYNIQMGLLGFWHEDAIALDIRSAWQVDNTPPTGRWSLSMFPGRIVVHAVFDTTVDSSDRVRLYIDGSRIDPTFVNPPGEGDTLTVSEDAFLVLGNRPSGSATLGGTLFYAAIYDRALTPAEVDHNAAILLDDDDTPP